MKRSNLNFLIDTVAFIGFILLTTTGVLMRYILPPGSGRYSTIWGLDRHDWGGIHFWISVALFSILTLHLFLHWQWIKCVFMGQPRQGSGFRAGLGIVGLLAVIALSLSPLLAPVEKSSENNTGSALSSHKFEDIDIRGSMTLRDVEESTGVPADHIIESLKLPAGTSADDKIGTLKRQYGFELNEVREIVDSYRKKNK